jgi:hypothetical protein
LIGWQGTMAGYNPLNACTDRVCCFLGEASRNRHTLNPRLWSLQSKPPLTHFTLTIILMLLVIEQDVQFCPGSGVQNVSKVSHIVLTSPHGKRTDRNGVGDPTPGCRRPQWRFGGSCGPFVCASGVGREECGAEWTRVCKRLSYRHVFFKNARTRVSAVSFLGRIHCTTFYHQLWTPTRRCQWWWWWWFAPLLPPRGQTSKKPGRVACL